MLQSFHIKNYRGFKNFTIEPLDRVNLITGSNNVGKTSLLEALYLNLAPGSAFSSNLGTNKPESSTWLNLFRGFKDVGLLDNVSKWGWLFYGKDLSQCIELTSDKNDELQILKMDWLIPHKGGGVQIPNQISILDNLQIYLDVNFKNYDGKELSWRLEKRGDLLQKSIPAHITDSIPLRLLFNPSSRLPEEDTKWFSKLDDVGRQDEIVETLQLIEPRLKSLAISTSDGPAMIYGDIRIGRRVPMAQMGEGMVRLLSLVLEITNAAGGVVLIDEVEVGLHHSVLTKVWKAIAEAARRSDTQIFATTHSWECIQAAHEAFLESRHYDLRLHRLERINGDIKAITYDQKTLETSVEMNLEVR